MYTTLNVKQNGTDGVKINLNSVVTYFVVLDPNRKLLGQEQRVPFKKRSMTVETRQLISEGYNNVPDKGRGHNYNECCK